MTPLRQRMLEDMQIRNLFEQGDVVIPGDLCKHLLHNLAIGPSRREGAHVFQIAGRKPLISGKASRRSEDSRSITFAPQPSFS